MRTYEILSAPQYKTLVESLETKDVSEADRKLGCVPEEYVAYMREVGWGEIGQAVYMIYSAPSEVSSAFPDAPDDLKPYALFGDDFAGYAGAFHRVNGQLVEICLSDWTIVRCDETFFEFVVDKFSNQPPLQ